jgi:hypothetical protein
MAWSNSKMFRAMLEDIFRNTAAFDVDTDAPKCALYDNDITPDNDVSAANSAYNAGQWTSSGNEVFEAGQWAQGGVAHPSPALTVAADLLTFDSSDIASGSAADLANVFGCLDYNDTIASPVADQGICYRYFGGSNSIVNGTFTVVNHPNGIWRITL